MIELLTVAIGVGLAVSLLFSEMFGLAAGGMVVPGYCALFLNRPFNIALTLIAALLITLAVGYGLGYGGARLLRLGEREARTVAIEVGLQNAGMATGLALGPLKSAEAALAPAVFGPWMNASGSVLASFWRRRPVKPSLVSEADAST